MLKTIGRLGYDHELRGEGFPTLRRIDAEVHRVGPGWADIFDAVSSEAAASPFEIGRAVRNLEDHLGVQLLIRATRSVRLTPIGASFAAEIRDVLEHLAAATSAATAQTSGIVSVSTIDSFAARWLMPRLFRFRRTHGDIDVRVATSERLTDFVSDGIDIAIRCGGGQYPGLPPNC